MMVKCVICGAVFADDIDICPVCGVGREHFVKVEPEPAAFSRNTQERFLVLGGGIAALSAAEAIRERNATCNIVMVTEEDVPPYLRTKLTKDLGATYEAIRLHDDAWYAQQNIVVLTGRRVTALLPDAREAVLDGDMHLAYDRCILALGASSFVPPIEGADLPFVYTIRSLSDMQRIMAAIDSGKRRAVVVGGGVLGLETAWALSQRSCDVTVVEREARIMMRQLDGESSALLSGLCARAGVRVLPGEQVQSIQSKGDASFVALASGEQIQADIVVLSSGVSPNAQIAKDAGIHAPRAIAVDDAMQTSDPFVYACGDCAAVDGTYMALWPVATEMGRVAGANAAGDALRYTKAPVGVSFTGMHTTLFAIGDVGFDADKAYHVESRPTGADDIVDRRYFADGDLCGAILIGDVQKAGELQL